jgi:hypothetical protein
MLQPLVVPTMVWVDITLDFVEGLSKVHGKSVILTVVDRFSKALHFIPLGHPYTATSVARVFFDTVVKLHGIPHSLVSDRDLVFTGHFWRELFTMVGVQLQFSSAFHPLMDEQSEATNKIIAMYLHCLATVREIDCSGCCGRNFVITRPSSPRCARRRSRWCTAGT